MFELGMSLQSLMLALALILVFLGPCPGKAAPPGELDEEAFELENYDLNSEMDWENLDVNIYGDSYDYDDLDQEVRGRDGWNTIIYCIFCNVTRFFQFNFLPEQGTRTGFSSSTTHTHTEQAFP